MGEYVGLDVSKEETAFCVKDGAGKVLARGKVATDPAAIFEALREPCPCAKRIVLATGTMSGWLTSRRFQSGEMDYSGRISKHGDTMVRSLLYEAANAVLSVVHKAHPLKDWARRIGKRSSHKKACVASARHIPIWSRFTLRRTSSRVPAGRSRARPRLSRAEARDTSRCTRAS